MLKWVVVVAALLLIAALIVPRAVSDDPAVWHADPRAVTPSDRPNSYLVADYDAVTLPAPPGEVLARFDRIAMAEQRTEKLVQDDGRVTYVQRSAVFGFPDYISVNVAPVEDGSSVTIFSRSRFGHSDLGVNKARVERWLDKLQAEPGS